MHVFSAYNIRDYLIEIVKMTTRHDFTLTTMQQTHKSERREVVKGILVLATWVILKIGIRHSLQCYVLQRTCVCVLQDFSSLILNYGIGKRRVSKYSRLMPVLNLACFVVRTPFLCVLYCTRVVAVSLQQCNKACYYIIVIIIWLTLAIVS